MVPKKIIKLARSLQQKKYRYHEKLFLVEGAKSIVELLTSPLTVRTLIGTSVFFKQHESLIEKYLSTADLFQTNESTLSSISSFKHNNSGVALVEMPPPGVPPVTVEGYILVLDDIQDPGNLGTIIRIADWYGIQGIVSSLDTTDQYSPKVISGSMGSFLRVPFYRSELPAYLSQVSLPVYGSLVDQGESVHTLNFSESGLIILGNESNGMQEDVEKWVSKSVRIPQFGMAESLNVGIAAAVMCDNMRRCLEGKDATPKK